MELICACADESLKKKLDPKISKIKEINKVLDRLDDVDEETADMILAGNWEYLPEREKYNKLANKQDDLEYEIVRILRKESPCKCEFSDLSPDYPFENPALEVEILLEIHQRIHDLLDHTKTTGERIKEIKAFPGERLFTDKNELPALYDYYSKAIQKIGIPQIVKRLLVSREDFEEDVIKKVLKKELDIIKKAIDGNYHYVSKLYGDAI